MIPLVSKGIPKKGKRRKQWEVYKTKGNLPKRQTSLPRVPTPPSFPGFYGRSCRRRARPNTPSCRRARVGRVISRPMATHS